jgi:hypothetical protein
MVWYLAMIELRSSSTATDPIEKGHVIQALGFDAFRLRME